MSVMESKVCAPRRNGAGGKAPEVPFTASTTTMDSPVSYSYSSYSYSSYSYNRTSSTTESRLTLSGGSSGADKTRSKFLQLPPRVPYLPQRSGGEITSPAKQKPFQSKLFESCNDSSSYGYSFSGTSDMESEESTTDSSGSYSYSYSDKSSDNSNIDDVTRIKHSKAGVHMKLTGTSLTNTCVGGAVTSKGGEKSSFIDPTSSLKSSSSFSYSYSYTGTQLGSYSTESSSMGRKNYGGSSDGYSYSHSELASENTSGSVPALSTMTKGSLNKTDSLIVTGNQKNGIEKSFVNDEFGSYSYSYSYDSEYSPNFTALSSKSFMNTDSGMSGLDLTLSDTYDETASTFRLENNKQNKKGHLFYSDAQVAPLFSSRTTVASETFLPQKATTATATTTTTSLIAGSILPSSKGFFQEKALSISQKSADRFENLTASETGVSMFSTQLREVLTLAVPKDTAPRIPLLPKSCLVSRGSANDTLSRFLGRLLIVQTDVLQVEAEKRAAETVSLSKGGAKSKNKKEISNANVNKDVFNEQSPVRHMPHTANIPPGHFIKKSLKFALGAVGVESPEERALVLNGVSPPLSFDATLTLLMDHARGCLLRRITSIFLAHDKFYSGEVPLEIAVDVLCACGIACQNVEDVTMCLCAPTSSKGRFPFLRVSQRMPSCGPPSATTEGERRSVSPKTQVNEEIVDVCGGALPFSNVVVFFDDRKGDVYVGNRVVVCGITSSFTANSICMRLDALIYVCIALHACSVDNGISCTVLYRPLLSSLLSSIPDTPPCANSIVFENAMVSVLKPEKQLEKLSAYHRLQKRYLGDGEDAVLGDIFLMNRGDVECLTMQNMCKNIYWAPAKCSDGCSVYNQHPMGSDDMCFEVVLTKLRLTEMVPSEARCYCLISVRSLSNNEWLPPLMVPVAKVGVSKKGGFKWTFPESRRQNHLLLACGRADRLYIEACYDVEEAGVGEKVTWCAGHVFVACGEVKSGQLAIRSGSVLSDDTSSSPSAAPARGRRRFLHFLGRKKEATPATSLTVVTKAVGLSSLPPRALLPECFVAFWRHVPLIARLREAVESLRGADEIGMHPLRLLRQQQVRCCLTVARNSALMDALHVLWNRTLAGKMGARPRTEVEQRKAILTLVSKVVAASNNTTENQDLIADVVARGGAIPFSATLTAPQRPVLV